MLARLWVEQFNRQESSFFLNMAKTRLIEPALSRPRGGGQAKRILVPGDRLKFKAFRSQSVSQLIGGYPQPVGPQTNRQGCRQHRGECGLVAREFAIAFDNRFGGDVASWLRRVARWPQSAFAKHPVQNHIDVFGVIADVEESREILFARQCRNLGVVL